MQAVTGVQAAFLELPTAETHVGIAALQYARAGLPPVPLWGITENRCQCGKAKCSAGKHPIEEEWQKKATLDHLDVRARFHKHDGNIGIYLASTGLVLLDGDNAGALAELRSWGLPPTLTAQSGRGPDGAHFLFRLASHQDAALITDRRLADGLDVKVRGQVVVAPSRHVTGGVYRWVATPGIAWLPDNVYERLKTPVRPAPTPPSPRLDVAETGNLHERARLYLAEIPPAISGDGGHPQTFKAARALAGFRLKGLGDGPAWDLFCRWNMNCQPPWSQKDLRHKFDEGMKAEVKPVLGDKELASGAFRVAPRSEPPAVDEGIGAPKKRFDFEILDAAAIAEPMPDLEYLVKGIELFEGSGAPDLVVGYGYSGKTLAWQAMLLAVAAGRGVWGHHPCKRSKVVHVDYEQGSRLTKRRYQRLAYGMGLDWGELQGWIELVVMPPLGLNAKQVDVWMRLCEGKGLCLIDSWRAASVGVDENSSEVRLTLDLLGHVSEHTWVRPQLIHHMRKEGDTPSEQKYMIRGSGGFYDGSDSVYGVSAREGEPSSVSHIRARTTGTKVESFALKIDDVPSLTDPKAGLRVSLLGIEEVKEKRARGVEAARQAAVSADSEKLRAAIAKQPGLGVTQLKGLLGWNGPRWEVALLELGARVEVRKLPSGEKGGKPVLGHWIRG